uniref:Protein kinase domain-containing protein n=1 Tax=Mycena chlorophos TaxID=658473 RepID=A0ABQ0LBT8_MYCCL|nr:predicted protein [Mycena chlorophos]
MTEITPVAEAASVRARTRGKGELWWVAHQPLFSSRGYELRSRYHADWIPSWILPGGPVSQHAAEDGFHGWNNDILDATRMSDGTKVVFKRLLTTEFELVLAVLHANISPFSRSNGVYAPISPGPCLHAFLQYRPRARSDFERGCLADIGLRDACRHNLMMDASRVVPGGSHFYAHWAHPNNLRVRFRWRDRCSVAPVNYYFIDFGLSEYYPDGQDSAVVIGSYGQDGNAFVRVLAPFPAHEEYLAPLLESMTTADPNVRPTAAEALKHFEKISAGIPDAALETIMEYQPDSDSDAEDLNHEIASDDEPYR